MLLLYHYLWLTDLQTKSLEKSLSEHMGSVLSALSNVDAIEIFTQVQDGMKGGRETFQKLQMTKKRYYTRLRELVESGLIERVGDEYRYTLLGTLFAQQFTNLLQIVENRKELLMIGELRRSEKFTDAEIGSFVRKIFTKGPWSSGEGSWFIPYVVWTYEEMVKSIVGRLSTTKKEIYLSSRYTAERIINGMIARAQAGVAVKVLADVRLLKNYVKGAGNRLETADKHADERRKATVNPFYPYNIERKFCELPFSFILMDGRGVGVELIDARHPDEFFCAVFLENESMFNYMRSAFDSLWETGFEDAVSAVPSTGNKAAKPNGTLQ